MQKSYKKFLLTIKWYKNDNGGDRRPIAIDYTDKKDLEEQKAKILNDFRTLPMEEGFNGAGKIPLSVNLT